MVFFSIVKHDVNDVFKLGKILDFSSDRPLFFVELDLYYELKLILFFINPGLELLFRLKLLIINFKLPIRYKLMRLFLNYTFYYVYF